MAEKYGWVEYVNLGAQIAQASAQTASTWLMQSESLRTINEIGAKQYLAECENSLNRSSMTFEKYPYYTILRLEMISENFRLSNVQSFLTEIPDLRIANDFQINIDNRIRDLLSEGAAIDEKKLSELKDGLARMERIDEAYNCINQNKELKDIELEYNNVKNDLIRESKERKILLTSAVLVSLLFGYLLVLSLGQVLFIFGLFCFLPTKFFQSKMPSEIEQKMFARKRNLIVIQNTISSNKNISSEEEIVEEYIYYSNLFSQNFPSEYNYFL